jgi:hypothetical protein
MMRRLSLAGVAVAIALAGCGGSSGPSLSTFKSDYAAQKKSFDALGHDLQAAITQASGKTDAQLATQFSGLATRAKQEATSLSKLKPTNKYKADLQGVVNGFDAVSSDLSSISTAATQHNATQAKSATEKLIQDAAKVKSSDTAITSGLHLPAG